MREYGDPRHNETEFKNLLSYSPLHNVRLPNGTHQYPATLLTVGKYHFVPLPNPRVCFKGHSCKAL